MARPMKETGLTGRQLASMLALVSGLRAEGYGWQHCADRVNGRFRTFSVSKNTLERMVVGAVGDPQADLPPFEAADAQNERRRKKCLARYARRRRAYLWYRRMKARGL